MSGEADARHGKQTVAQKRCLARFHIYVLLIIILPFEVRISLPSFSCF